jgi:chromate reductase
MKILIVSTSPRNGSLTLRFARFLKMLLEKQETDSGVELLDFAHFDISPLGKGNFPSEPATVFQTNLLEKWQAANLIIICSPEYNWTASAETFVLLERLGNKAYRDFFDNKVFATAGISSGRGGRQPALDISRVLSKIIGFLSTESMVSSKILEVHEAGINLDEDSLSKGNQAFEEAVTSFAGYSIRMARRWFSQSNPA